MIFRTCGAAVSVCLIAPALLIAPVLADDATPDSEGGRYTFSKVDAGFLRLDTQTGAVSICSQHTVGWACQAVPEDRAVLENEIARLRSENVALKKEILAHGLPLPAGAVPEAPGGRGTERNIAAPRQRRCRPCRGHGRPAVATVR